MKKAPEAFRTISEVSEILDTPAHVLRFWESKFYQVRPVKRAGGRRYYRPDDVALIAGIKHLLQDRGMTIRGVQKIMQEEGARHVVGIGRSTGRIELEPAEDSEAALATEAVTDDAPNDAPIPAVPSTAETAPGALAATALADAPPEAPEPSQPALPLSPPPTEMEAAAAGTENAQALEPAANPVAADPDPSQSDTAADPDPDDARDPDAPRLARLLRQMPAEAEGTLPAAALVQRLDRLLDRMAAASGTRRW